MHKKSYLYIFNILNLKRKKGILKNYNAIKFKIL